MTFEEAAAVMMGGSGTGANASLYSAICSLPVVAESEIIINEVPTGYKVRVHNNSPDIPGFWGYRYDGLYDKKGNVQEPPETSEFSSIYYFSLCIGDEVIFVSDDAEFYTLHKEVYSNCTINSGESVKRYKSVDETYNYKIILDSFYAIPSGTPSGLLLGVGYDLSWTRQYYSYVCDDSGNIAVDQNVETSGTYTKGIFTTLDARGSYHYLTNYSDFDTLRQKIIQFQKTITALCT